VDAIPDASRVGSDQVAAKADRKSPRILFIAANTIFAVDLPHVAEIIEPERWTRVPHAASWVEGLLYHHGEAIAVANAGSLFEGTPTPRGGSAVVIRLSDARARAGLLVDKVLGTWRGGEAQASQGRIPFVKGVWDRKGRIVNLLDVEALLERMTRMYDD
jgi:chemotaxis signal transduction protein